MTRLLHFQPSSRYRPSDGPGMFHPKVCNPRDGWLACLVNVVQPLMRTYGRHWDLWIHNPGGVTPQMRMDQWITAPGWCRDTFYEFVAELTSMGIGVYAYIGGTAGFTTNEQAWLPLVEAGVIGIGFDSAASFPESHAFNGIEASIEAQGVKVYREANPYTTSPDPSKVWSVERAQQHRFVAKGNLWISDNRHRINAAKSAIAMFASQTYTIDDVEPFIERIPTMCRLDILSDDAPRLLLASGSGSWLDQLRWGWGRSP